MQAQPCTCRSILSDSSNSATLSCDNSLTVVYKGILWNVSYLGARYRLGIGLGLGLANTLGRARSKV